MWVGLLKKLLESEEVTKSMLQQGNRTSLPSALKKVLYYDMLFGFSVCRSDKNTIPKCHDTDLCFM